VIPDLTALGDLPLGRFPASEHAIRGRFVEDAHFNGSTTRNDIWDHYLLARQALVGILPIAAVWIGGSFVSGKIDPDDIDVVWLLDGANYPALTPAEQGILGAFATKGVLRANTGWRVDSFLLQWIPVVVPNPGHPMHVSYFYARGHWDDFWQRKRVAAGAALPASAGTVPQRGYLEVMLGGYLPV
jgi:hypothetical protein